MLTTCLLTAILVVSPATPGLERYLPATWAYESPTLAGTCFSTNELVSMHINNQHHMIVDFMKKRFVIPLPPEPGRWKFRFVIGSEFATIESWGKVQVRQGPELPI